MIIQKDTAAAPATALERDQILNKMSIFDQLYEYDDWEGLLQLE